MPELAKEDWLKTTRNGNPLWPEFEEFLQGQARACRERERLGLITAPSTQRECTRCKAKNHTVDTCRAQYCLNCRSWKCNKKFHKKERGKDRDTQSGGDSYCGLCREVHPFNKHTKSRTDAKLCLQDTRITCSLPLSATGATEK